MPHLKTERRHVTGQGPFFSADRSSAVPDTAPYAAPCKIEMFLETGQTPASSATPEDADLPRARAYIATKPDTLDILSAKKIKGLIGGEQRMSRGLYASPFFWTPQGMPIPSCNRTLKIKDEDEGNLNLATTVTRADRGRRHAHLSRCIVLDGFNQ